MLDGLADIPWGQLTHAYGSAADVPELLLRLARGDEDALSEFYANIWHQGTVYEASPYVVPFLVELLEAPDANRNSVLMLLQALATGTTGNTQDTKKAVAAHWRVYLQFLSSNDSKTRAIAAHVIGCSAAPSQEVIDALIAHGSEEEAPCVRSSIVLALGQLVSPTQLPIDTWLAAPEPVVRVVTATLALQDTSAARHANAVLARDVPAAYKHLSTLSWVQVAREPIPFILESLQNNWEDQVSLLSVWLGSNDEELRSEVVYACEELSQTWRPATAQLIPRLAQCLRDPSKEVRNWAASTLAGSGRGVTAVASELLTVLEEAPLEWNSPPASALLALCKVRDERVLPHLLRALKASKGGLPSPLGPALKYLGPWAGPCGGPLLELLPQTASPTKADLISAVGRYELGDQALARIAAEWQAQPRLVCLAMAHAGFAAQKHVGFLRELLADAKLAVPVARVLWRCTGDVQSALSHASTALRGPGNEQIEALRLFRDMGSEAREMERETRRLYSPEGRPVSAAAAVALWHIAQDPRPILSTSLDGLEGTPTGLHVLEIFGQVGSPAKANLAKLVAGASSSRRQIQVGTSSDWIDRDEQWMDACALALESIPAAKNTPS